MIERLAMWAHPGWLNMLRWHDRELGRMRTWWVRKHLAQCEQCSARFRELTAASTAVDRALTEPPLEKSILIEGRLRLVDDMAQYRAVALPLTGDLLIGLLDQIRRCLGEQAAQDIEQQARREPDGRKVIHTIRPLMKTFLGEAAALNWQQRILTSLEKTNRGQDL